MFRESLNHFILLNKSVDIFIKYRNVCEMGLYSCFILLFFLKFEIISHNFKQVFSKRKSKGVLFSKINHTQYLYTICYFVLDASFKINLSQTINIKTY